MEIKKNLIGLIVNSNQSIFYLKVFYSCIPLYLLLHQSCRSNDDKDKIFFNYYYYYYYYYYYFFYRFSIKCVNF